MVEHLCALSGGRLTVDEIAGMTQPFLASGLAVRLTPVAEGGRRRPPQWSTAAHRALEDQVVALLDQLAECWRSPMSTPRTWPTESAFAS